MDKKSKYKWNWMDAVGIAITTVFVIIVMIWSDVV